MFRGDLVTENPVRLQVETTDVCNLKCRMCAREALDGLDSTTMSLASFTRLVKEVNPFYVTLNGLGEPLIDKTIFEKLDVLHERKIYSSMPTNSSFLDGKRLTRLLASFPSVLTLSIDGATKQSYEYVRKLANFEKTVTHARNLIARRKAKEGRPGQVRLLCALQKANLLDFKEMFQLLKSLGTRDFFLVPVFDYDPNGTLYNELIPTKDDVAGVLKAIDEHIAVTADPEERAFVSRWRDTASLWLTDHRVTPEKNRHSCVVPWFSSYVDAKGRVYPCCYLLTSEHVMGNINEESFEAIWKGEKYQAFRQDLMSDRPHVGGCNVCPRNDDGLLRTLGTYQLLLLSRRSSPKTQPEEPARSPRARPPVRLKVLEAN